MTGRPAVPALLRALLLSSLVVAALACGGRAHAQDEDPEEEPILRSPTDRDAEEEASIEELEEAMVPTLTLPEFRIRVGGGVGLQTSGGAGENVFGRVTEEFEWQPAALEFLLFGIGGAQSIASNGSGIYQVGARVGGHAWFCQDATVRCQGAITLQLGFVGGLTGPNFDFSADADLRFLFGERVEIYARGGFFAVSMISFVNITAGIAIAF
jgi:hypothetical protein